MTMCSQPGRRLRTSLFTVFTAVLAAAGCGLADAAETDADAADLHLGGFGTLGLVHSNAPAGWGFRRDTTQPANDGGTRADIDTRLGLQANYRAAPQIEFVGQLVVAKRSAHAPLRDAVTLAFAAWRPADDITLRAGRLSTDYFLIPEYRHVGFAYPFVRPPVENYGGVPYTLDGADLTKAWRTDDAIWKLRGIGGRTDLAGDGTGAKVVLRPVHALVLSRDDGSGLLLKASAARVRLRVDTAPAQPLVDALRQLGALPVPQVAAEASELASAFALNGQTVRFYSMGVGLDRGPWLASLEVSRAEPRTARPYTSGWLLLGHRWGAFTGFGMLSATRVEHRRRPPQWAPALAPVIGAAAAAQVQQLGDTAFTAASAGSAGQRSATLGVRWDFADRMALKLQWDRVRVDAHGSQLWLNRTSDAIRADVGSATLDFVF